MCVVYSNKEVFECLGDSPPISSHLMRSSTSPLLNYNILKQQNKQRTKHFNLYWIALLKKEWKHAVPM